MPLFENDEATAEVELGAIYNSKDFNAANLMTFKYFNFNVIPQNTIDETVLQKDHCIPVRCEVESALFANESPMDNNEYLCKGKQIVSGDI